MKRRLLALYLVAFTTASAEAQDTTIAQRLAAEIRLALPGVSVSVPDPYGLDMTFGGQARSVGIGSVHTACARSTASCDEAIHDYAQRAASYMLETAPLSRDQLRIVVRTRQYLDGMAAQMGSADGFIVEALAGDLVSACYRDLPNGRRPIGLKDLIPLQLEKSVALSTCMANSHGSLPPLASLWRSLPQQGIGTISNGDDVTAYLSAPEDWQPLAQKLGALVVAAPSTDILLYNRGSNPIDVDALATLARQMHDKASTPVSAQVFRWTEDGWVVVP